MSVTPQSGDASADGNVTSLEIEWDSPLFQLDDAKRNPNATAIDNAIAYLLSQQSEDGGIKSKAYGVLRPGAATTALALYACSHAHAAHTEPHRQSLQKAQAFLARGLHEHGRVCAPDGTLDYPTYGAALYLVAADKLKLELSADDRQRLTQWIIDAQLTQRHEIAKGNIQYGGWDLEATSGAKGDQLKGTNISITSFALEALQGSMHKDAANAVERARGWVERCQNEDGGFVFHVWRAHPGNKAMWSDDAQANAVSYGTPTCDGLRSLMYCGATSDDDTAQRAVQWLKAHPDVKLVTGFEEESAKYGWREGLRFYYYLTQAKSLEYLPKAEAARRATALCNLLIAEQQSDGSFKNQQPRMFEDDPILATSLALAALAVASDFADQLDDEELPAAK